MLAYVWDWHARLRCGEAKSRGGSGLAVFTASSTFIQFPRVMLCSAEWFGRAAGISEHCRVLVGIPRSLLNPNAGAC